MEKTIHKSPKESDVKRLLRQCDLPISDITPAHLDHFFAACDDSGLYGIVGMELYGIAALLRSLAISPKHRNKRWGKRLVVHAEEYARTQGVRSIYLLTTTANGFFSKLGYKSLSRSEAPIAIQKTPEFSNLCTSSSVFMVKQLIK